MHATAAADGGRGWSWAALVGAVVLWLGAIPTFGLSVLLSPLSLLLTGVAWLRSAHDAVFWIGFGLNTVLTLGLLSFLVGLLIGDVGGGWE